MRRLPAVAVDMRDHVYVRRSALRGHGAGRSARDRRHGCENGRMAYEFERKQRIAILGGGPGGYEAALAGAQLGAEVTLVERVGVGGSAVLTDVVPSKTLIATAEAANAIGEAADLGVQFFTRGENGRPVRPEVAVNLAAVNQRLLRLARQQSEDMKSQLIKAGVRIVAGRRAASTGRTGSSCRPARARSATDFDEIDADTIVVSVGASPRILPTREARRRAHPHLDPALHARDGPRAPHRRRLRRHRRRVRLRLHRARLEGHAHLEPRPGAARRGRGCRPRHRGRLHAQRHDGALQVAAPSRSSAPSDGVVATLSDGRTVEGSHCLMAVGSVPNTAGIGLEEAGVQLTESGHIRVNRVARTSMPSIYAAGDCTDFLPLASVASMQGRTAVFHAMGDAVNPTELRNVTSNIFTQPEIATVGWSQKQIEDGIAQGEIYKLPLASNPRAKMMGIKDGFVKLFARTGSGTVIGGVIVAPQGVRAHPADRARGRAPPHGRPARPRVHASTRRSPAASRMPPAPCTSCTEPPPPAPARRRAALSPIALVITAASMTSHSSLRLCYARSTSSRPQVAGLHRSME